MKRMRDQSLPAQRGLLQVSTGRKEGSRSISHFSFSSPNLEIWFLVFLYSPMTLPLISFSWLCANFCSSFAIFSPQGWAKNSFSLFLAVTQMGLNLATHQMTSLKCVRVMTYSWSLWSLISMASSTILEVSDRVGGLAMGSMMGGALTTGGSTHIGSSFRSRSPSLYSKRRSGWPCSMVHGHLSSAMVLSSARQKVMSACPFLMSILSGPMPRSRWEQMASGVWKVKGALIMIIDLRQKRLQSLLWDYHFYISGQLSSTNNNTIVVCRSKEYRSVRYMMFVCVQLVLC